MLPLLPTELFVFKYFDICHKGHDVFIKKFRRCSSVRSDLLITSFSSLFSVSKVAVVKGFTSNYKKIVLSET